MGLFSRPFRKPDISEVLTDDYLGQLYESQGGNTSYKQREEGFGFSNVDLLKMQYDINQRDEERAYNEEMYEKYQTIPAQVAQMQEAGLNTALMYGDGASSPSAMSPSPEVDSGNVSSSGQSFSTFARISQLFSMITGGLQIASKINQETANAQLLRSEAKLNRIDADTRSESNKLTIEQMRSNIANANADTLLKEAEQEVAKTHVGVNVSQTALNELKGEWQKFSNRIAQVDAEVAERTKDVVVQYKSAELSYLKAQEDFTKAKTDESKTSAALNIANTALSHANQLLTMTKYMSEQEMLDSGYYLTMATKQAEEIKKIKQDIDTSKNLKDVYEALARLRGLEADNYKLEMWAGIITKGVGAAADVVGAASNVVGAAANAAVKAATIAK